jgi:hypothetical protein
MIQCFRDNNFEYFTKRIIHQIFQGPSWSHGNVIYHYQCPSPLTLRVQTLSRRDVLDTLCDKVTCPISGFLHQ